MDALCVHIQIYIKNNGKSICEFSITRQFLIKLIDPPPRIHVLLKIIDSGNVYGLWHIRGGTRLLQFSLLVF